MLLRTIEEKETVNTHTLNDCVCHNGTRVCSSGGKSKVCPEPMLLIRQAGVYIRCPWHYLTENISIPPGQDANPSQVTPQLSLVPISTPGWGEAMMIKCLAHGHKCRN